MPKGASGFDHWLFKFVRSQCARAEQ